MKEQFLETGNYIRFNEAIQGLKELPVTAPKLGLGYGNFGLGKTFSLEKIVIKENAILLRALQIWTKGSMLEELCDELGLDTQGQSPAKYKRIVESLLQEPRMIIVDEIDAILKSEKFPIMEMLRDIHDEVGVVIVFIGMEQSRAKLKKHNHFYSRITSFIEFKRIEIDDIRKYCELSDVKIEEDLIKYFYAKYPNLRQIKVLLLRAEKFCVINDRDTLDLKGFKDSGVEHDTN